ncbi:hypothetical protein GE09DRAFT_1227276 [Coniochaeta sp. 2T2.1]|nr:hypothetical protein GE09DRAFT_1227276 [Coniochaeta sp. 2T2.1]
MPPTVPPTPPTRVDGIQDYHRDIQTRFESAGTKIESLWKSFTRDQRLSSLLERSKRSSGDYALIFKNMTVNHLKHPEADIFEKSGTNISFQEGKNYGQPFKRSKELLASLRPSFPQHVGELVLFRQFRLLEGIRRLVDRILEEGAKVGTDIKSPASTAAVISSLPTISQPTASAITISSLACRAQDQMEWLERKQEALMTESELLADAVQTWFDTRPGLVANEKGETWPLHTDKHIGPAFFDVHRDAAKSAVISPHLAHLLQILEETDTSKRILRPMILKEIGEICHLEFDRAQCSLKRHIQRGIGKRWFKRVNRVTDLGRDAGVVAKVQPEQLTRWLENIGNLYEAAPSERERLTEAGF